MAKVPWIGVFKEEINTNPHEGVYLAYLFDVTQGTVTLSLQRGVTQLSKADRYGTGKALRLYLEERAGTYRRALPSDLLEGWQHGVGLKAKGDQWRPRAYQSANIAARRYEVADLPSEEELAQHLQQAVDLLSHAATVDRYSADLSFPTVEEPAVFFAGKHAPENGEKIPFVPGNDQEYVVTIKGGVERRQREHETVLTAFATHAIACAFDAQRQGIGHRDLILSRNDSSDAWLVEVKQIQEDGHRNAVRAAVAQLFEYRHAYYRQHGRPDPHLLAVFSAPIRDFGPYLESLGIAAVWPVDDKPLWWSGTPSAAQWDLVTLAT